MPEPKISVLIADDQPLFSSGLAMLIDAQPDMSCVGTAVDGMEAIEQTRTLRPSVVLMDLRMPALNGLDATRAVLADVDAPRVVVLTTLQSGSAVRDSPAAGASAFLTKDALPADVLATIRTVHAGESVPPSSMAVAVAARPGVDDRRERVLTALSPREREVFLLIARGPTNSEIATATWVVEATVKSHIRSILQKLDLRSRVQVVVFAYENGLVRN